MRKIIFLLLFSMISGILISEAGRPKKNNNSGQLYDFDQFDSLCIADSIPRDLSLWNSEDYYNDESDKVETKYEFNKNDNQIYKLKTLEDGYFLVCKTEFPF